MRYTKENCLASVPAILIDYLWELISEDEQSNQIFVLAPRYLGRGAVQDITVFTDAGCLEKTVFGCDPVDATLEIGRMGADLVMSLSSDTVSAYREHRREENACTV